MGTNPDNRLKKRWRFSLLDLFFAIVFVTAGLAVEIALLQLTVLQAPFALSRILIPYFGVPLGIAFMGAGIGALHGTRSAMLRRFFWSYAATMAVLYSLGRTLNSVQ